VALDDRDWYREKPSEAWRKMFPAREQQGSQEPELPPRRHRPRRRARAGSWIATLAIGAVFGLGFAAWQDNRFPWQDEPAQADPTPAPRIVTPAPRPKPQVSRSASTTKVVRLRSRPGLDTPAKHVTRWWITDARFGRVTVYVPVGTTPREALTRAIAAKGYQVLP
jgi:hypothetical protein